MAAGRRVEIPSWDVYPAAHNTYFHLHYHHDLPPRCSDRT